MATDLIAELAGRVGGERFVVFAGAGVSVGEPTALPGWWDLNKAILQALYERVQREFGIAGDYGRILLEYRETAKAFPPDYQAQAMAECAGVSYFEALQALDVAVTNRCHRALAALATGKRLAAIVTTNFDALIESALDEAGVPYAVAFDQDGFERLAREAPHDDVLPIIKIHGSVRSAASMIDTRKQRRRGRAPALIEILASLLRRHLLLYVGFSGADFTHDRHYLGIWDAAEQSPGFCFLFQPGRPPETPVHELVEHYGKVKASLLEVDAADALESLGALLGVPDPRGARAVNGPPTSSVVAARLRQWAGALDHWLALRMAAALQDAASMRVNALRMLRDGWNGRRPDDSPQFVLFAADWVRGRLRRARYDDTELRMAIRELRERGHPLGDPYQLVSDAFTTAHLPLGRGVLESLRGFAAGYGEQLSGWPATHAVDATLLMAQVASLFEDLPELAPALAYARDVAIRDGDDIREAGCLAELAVRAARAGRYAEAEAALARGRELANPVQERQVISTMLYAHALMYEHQGRSGEALGAGEMAFNVAVSDELRLPMTRALLVQLRVACRSGGAGNVERVQQRFGDVGSPLRHELWAHDLERRLYEAEFRRRCRDRGWEPAMRQVRDQARSSSLTWIGETAAGMLG